MKKICLVLVLIFMAVQMGFAFEAITVNDAGIIVSASSNGVEPETSTEITPSLAFRGGSNNPWIAAMEFDPARGEWLKANFTKPAEIKGICISPAYVNKPGKFSRFSRPRSFLVSFENEGKRETLYYNNRQDEQGKRILLLFETPIKTKHFTFKVFSVYPGTEYKNLAVGNVEFILEGKEKQVTRFDGLLFAAEFIQECREPEKVLGDITETGKLKINKVLRNSNPLQKERVVDKAASYSLDEIKKNMGIWATLCLEIYNVYVNKSHSYPGYYVENRAQNKYGLQLNSSPEFDVIESYTIHFEKEKKEDGNSRFHINRIDTAKGFYTP
ncbi:MAG: NADase-type glycan-binding domain-containing protein [Vulcanimicrobiota bacterium]